VRRQVALALPLALGAVGLALSWYLLRSHLEVFAGGLHEGFLCGGDGRAASPGNLGARFDCNAVAAHPSSWFLGRPLPVFGLLYYVAVLAIGAAAVLTRGADRVALLALGALAGCLALVVDLWLLAGLLFQVGALCAACLATYAVDLGLALSFWRLARGGPEPLRWSRVLPTGGDARVKGAVAVLAALTLGAVYVAAMRPLARLRAEGEEVVAGLLARLDAASPEIDMAGFADQPARGPEAAAVTIALAGDFQCAHCRSLARALHTSQRRWPEDLRVVWLNAPVSSRCNPAVAEDLHPEACWLAEVGEAAAARERFWAYHDWLMEAPLPAGAGRERVMGHLPELGLDPGEVEAALAGGAPRRAVARDVALCGQLGLTSTPSLAINGAVVRGALAPWQLERLLERLLGPAGPG
jgi:uncharacterized membrane protein/protein-disulfide isomerase